jgi:hypothetical protein
MAIGYDCYRSLWNKLEKRYWKYQIKIYRPCLPSYYATLQIKDTTQVLPFDNIGYKRLSENKRFPNHRWYSDTTWGENGWMVSIKTFYKVKDVVALYYNMYHNYVLRRFSFYTHVGKNLHDSTFSLREENRTHTASLTPKYVIEVPVPCKKSKQSCICVLGVRGF